MATSIGTTLANMFRPVQQVALTPQPPLGPQVAPPLAQQNPGAGTVPGAGTSLPTIDQTPANPMDDMAKLWQTDPKSVPSVDPMSTPLFNTDPAAIAAAAGKIDFIGQLPPEMVAKAMSGSDPQAFMQVMNAVAQRTLATATQLNAATIEQATTRNNARIQNALPNRVRQIQLDSIQPENPALQHAASQPLLQMVRAQIQMKNPGISAAEVNKQAETYLVNFAGQLHTPAADDTGTGRPSGTGTDWDTWAAAS